MQKALRSLVLLSAMVSCLDAAAKTLDVYFIDVEGGQATLVVSPSGQAFLIDAGYAGDGSALARAGDPKLARDANRILAAARAAGIKQIDYLMITHFHSDHDGGVIELSQLLPINTFVDHGSVLPEAELTVPGSREYFNAYAAVRSTGRHLEPKPGDRLPLKGVEVTVVSSARATLARPLGGAGRSNSACGTSGRPAQEPYENPRSTGVLVRFGRFRFLDVGDLSGPPLYALACPNNMVGPVDAYLVAHHGGIDAAEPATFAAFKPRVAVMNNGTGKGGARETYALLHQSPHVGDVWQLHRSNAAGEQNSPDEHVANLDESTANWIKLSANRNGSFEVTNARTGTSRHYPAR
jgi:competence protein ComEC